MKAPIMTTKLKRVGMKKIQPRLRTHFRGRVRCDLFRISMVTTLLIIEGEKKRRNKIRIEKAEKMLP